MTPFSHEMVKLRVEVWKALTEVQMKLRDEHRVLVVEELERRRAVYMVSGPCISKANRGILKLWWYSASASYATF